MSKVRSSQDIRNAFTQFFEARGHRVVPSSPLVPANDPTLLFTNAGMVQFKDVFLGKEKRDYNRAVSIQRCVRAGGKHNDLENVGYTARHHTFFEMLGNFSFGDYFKKEAIAYAWEFLTEVLGLPPERLWVTVHHSDQEAEDIWLKDIGVDPERFSRLGDKDNFWAMGDTGPCGPCSEIFYDHGPDVAGGPPGSPDEDGDRYIEIWNLVFMQYARDAEGNMTPLPNPSIDTGMGLERIAAVLQGVHSNYEIDTFQALIRAAARETGCDDLENRSLRVIADHIRSCAFMILDGVTPSNEGRGYVLRRIVRRAIRHGYKLGATGAFFHKLLPDLVQVMGAAYPALGEASERIGKALAREEEQFARTIEQGMQLLEAEVASLAGKRLPGDVAFRLYDTYGFPLDLTEDVLREKGLEVDRDGFETCMQAQRERSKEASQFAVDYGKEITSQHRTEFLGYEQLRTNSKVVELFRDGQRVERLQQGEQGIVVLDQTPFYAESGGQVGDAGTLTSGSSRFQVNDTKKSGAAWLHYGKVESGCLQVGDKVEASVEHDKRWSTARHHSATHLLHAALRELLGDHVMQKGSLVAPDRLRFDFSHPEPLSDAQLQQLEERVNEEIWANHPVITEIMSPDEARQAGAMALFGEKYGEKVRVLTMGNFSKELCGGTHVSRTGDIGLFRIVAETGIASGVRRIEAVAAHHALAWTHNREHLLKSIAGRLKVGIDDTDARVEALMHQVRTTQAALEKAQAQLALGQGGGDSQSEIIAGIKVAIRSVEGLPVKALRETVDNLKQQLGSGVVILANRDQDKAQLMVGVTRDLTGRLHAGDMVRELAAELGGKGGGRPDMAQGGGPKPERIDQVLEKARAWIAARLEE